MSRSGESSVLSGASSHELSCEDEDKLPFISMGMDLREIYYYVGYRDCGVGLSLKW